MKKVLIKSVSVTIGFGIFYGLTTYLFDHVFDMLELLSTTGVFFVVITIMYAVAHRLSNSNNQEDDAN